MKSVRIGNDIRIEWTVSSVSSGVRLEDLDLSVEVILSDAVVDWRNYKEAPVIHSHRHVVMSNGGVGVYGWDCKPPKHRHGEPCVPPAPFFAPVKLPHYIEDGKIVAIWEAESQFALGEYDILLYANKDGGGRGVADQCRFVRLVAHTAQADLPEDGDVEAVVSMQPLTLSFSGMSAYDVAVSEGFEGTKSEWLESLKQPAEDAAEDVKAMGDYAKSMGDYAKSAGDGVQEATENATKAATEAMEVATHPTYVGTDNYIYEWDVVSDVYVKTDKIVKSQPLTIDVKYSSVALLEADKKSYNDGLFAIVDTGSVEDADNARLYIRKNDAWEFVVDMSGATGSVPHIELGTVSLGAGLEDGTVTLTQAGVDDQGIPKYVLGFVIPRLTYDDLTEAQIAELQKPAKDIIAEVKAAGDACVAQTELCKDATDDAEELNAHPTKQGENGNWWRWDLNTGAYIDTGVKAKGGILYPSFEIEEDMCLYMNYDDEAAVGLVGLDADTGVLYLEY